MKTLDAQIHALMRDVSERAIMPKFRNLASAQIIKKAQDDLVTVADREAELLLAEGLAKIDPSLAIVGEEAAYAEASLLEALKGDCWIIDPIDGTHNFAHGHAPFGILLARARGGMAEAGWIYDCVSGRFCSAQRGSGAFVDGESIVAKPTGTQPPIAAISLIFLDQEQRKQVQAHIAPYYTTVDIPRCAAEQYPRLALGQNDVSFFERTLAWDHAAGALWLEEAGGMIARPDGSPYRVDEWDRRGLIGAASPALWEALADHHAKLA